MRRVRPASRPRTRRVLGAILLAGLIGSSAIPVRAQDLPPCDDGRTSECQLPDWSVSPVADLPSLFGEVEGLVWAADAEGDAPPTGLDILGAGVGRVEITEPVPIRQSDALLRRGTRKKAVPRGPGVLVRIVLDRGLEEVEGAHSGVHLATDVDGSRSNNAPTGVADPDSPFAGSGEVYSLTWASTTGKSRLLASDLARGWYKAKTPLAAAWAAPGVLDLLIAPGDMGPGFRVVTHVDGETGGYDSLAMGTSPVPADGLLGLTPACIEGAIAGGPFVVSRLIENGQTLRNVEAPASWRGGVSLPVDGDMQAALATLVAERDEVGDGRIALPATISLFEDGIVIRQEQDVLLALDGDQAQLSLELGLTRRGYNVLRDIELEAVGDELVDGWLERATDAFSQHMPPFRSTKQTGLVAGDGIGSCVPWLEPPAEPAGDGDVAAEGDLPADAADAAADA